MSENSINHIQRIHLIYKTHLDVGFTDFAANVVKNYFTRYIPKAIELAETLRRSGSPDRFIWTTGSWLIYEYLEQADADGRKRMEAAIASGDITWHALPFTTHSENMDASLFRFGLSLSQALDRRFGKHTIAAKMTDVPGHTRAIVPLLAEAGVQFLHIGVNGSSTPPNVSPVFTWRDTNSGTDVMVMYHKGSYGDLMLVPGMHDGIAFAHTGDNQGPQSAELLHEGYQAMRAKFPGVEVFASTMDAFASQLAEVKASLPVITQEIGDTWIHGAATDPKKEAQYREMLRMRRGWLETGTPAADLQTFSRKLLQVPEHTWGLDVKTHLNDWTHYRANDFQAARKGDNFKKMEASWQEQRNYVRDAVDALPVELKQQAKARLADLEAEPVNEKGFEPIHDFSQSFPLGLFTANFDPEVGALTHLEIGGINWAGTHHPLGKFWYEAFSADDYRRFRRQYSVNKRETRSWAIPDFTKPGIEGIAEAHKVFLPRVIWAGRDSSETQDRFLIKLEMPAESWQDYGAPQQAILLVTAARAEPEVRFDLRWFNKPACRLPEAAWFSFIPQVRDPHRWRMDKLGEWISPYEVIRDGNRHLHAVGLGARSEGPLHRVTVETLDTALLAPGNPSLLDFNNRQPDLRQGLHFNLHNNLWGTNFPMWYEDDARFRFIFRVEPEMPA